MTAEAWGWTPETHLEELAERAADVLRNEAAAAGITLNPGQSGGNVTAEWREYRRTLRDDQDTFGNAKTADIRLIRDELVKTGHCDHAGGSTLLASPIGVRTTSQHEPSDVERVETAVMAAAGPRQGWAAGMRLASEIVGRPVSRPMPRHGAAQVEHGSRSALLAVAHAAIMDADDAYNVYLAACETRREAVKGLRDSGMTLAAVGALLGVSRQAVSKLTG